MSELRHDPLSGHDVIVAAGRAARPNTFTPPAAGDATEIDGCPFCAGSESQTPPEVARTGEGAPDTPGWRVRAFPNLYPIVQVHEVVVLSPDHRSFADLDDVEAVEVMTMLRDRVRSHLDAGHVYGVAILNHLRGAGASIAHPHAQVFALDVVPAAVEAALARFGAADDDLVAADAGPDDLVVARLGAVRTWCPYASTSPYLMRLAHDRAGARFDETHDDAIADVARSLRDALRRVRTVMGDAPYNVVAHTAPRRGGPFHWYVEITPRVSVVAGFEQATGILVNTVPPEAAARDLRVVGP